MLCGRGVDGNTCGYSLATHGIGYDRWMTTHCSPGVPVKSNKGKMVKRKQNMDRNAKKSQPLALKPKHNLLGTVVKCYEAHNTSLLSLLTP